MHANSRRLAVSLALSLFIQPSFAADTSRGICSSKSFSRAENQINKDLSVLVDNAPMECILLRENQIDVCGILCASKFQMTESQRFAAITYMVGTTGKSINNLGREHFDKVMYVDNSTAENGYGYEIEAADAARIQSAAFSNRLTAPQVLAEIKKAMHRRETKHSADK